MKCLIYKVLSEINTGAGTFIPIQTLHLLSKLDDMLISFLEKLSDNDWHAQTVAKRWCVKDVASHLLDGNLRSLSMARDRYFSNDVNNVNTFHDLVTYINELNMSWTNATKRLSPRLLIELLKISGQEYIDYLHTLHPFDEAIFSVAWAGQEKSPNWFHIAREYTEKYLHQLQIRDCFGNKDLFTKELFYPFMDIYMYALPHTFYNSKAKENTVITIIITSDIGGQWNIINCNGAWILNTSTEVKSDSIVKIPPELAWKLFSKSIRPEEIMKGIEITGNMELAKQSLQMVAVMA